MLFTVLSILSLFSSILLHLAFFLVSHSAQMVPSSRFFSSGFPSHLHLVLILPLVFENFFSKFSQALYFSLTKGLSHFAKGVWQWANRNLSSIDSLPVAWRILKGSFDHIFFKLDGVSIFHSESSRLKGEHGWVWTSRSQRYEGFWCFGHYVSYDKREKEERICLLKLTLNNNSLCITINYHVLQLLVIQCAVACMWMSLTNC